MRNNCKILGFIMVVVLLQACSSTKYLAPGEDLYVGATVKVKPVGKVSKKQQKAIKSELNDIARPHTNSTILGIRFKLFVYNAAGNPKKKGIRHWLKYTVGEPPVIASMTAMNKNSVVFQDRLENSGYFRDTVTLDTSVHDKKLKAIYTAYIDEQYKIGKVKFPQGDDTLSVSIRKHVKNTVLKPGVGYDLDLIKDERSRIDSRLKEHGFYYFSPNDLIAKIDSTAGNHTVNVDIQIKPKIPLDAGKSYRINNIVVYADYYTDADTSRKGISAKYSNGYTIIDPKGKFRPTLFDKVLVFKKDSTYNLTSHNLALNRLVTLGTYKFVKARFEKSDTAYGDYLNLYYYLTPFTKKSIKFTATTFTKSNSASGGQLSVDLLNRNLFKGAEQFAITPYVGLEQQFSGQKDGTRRGGIDISLSMPQIISPFKFKINSGFVPRTKIDIGYEVFSSDTLYTLSSFYASYGYSWRQNQQTEATFNILNASYVRPTSIKPAFQSELDEDNTLYRSIEPQLIIGSSYNYNVNTQIKQNNHKNNFYFNGNIDASGNLIGLIGGASIANANKGKTINIFNVPLSQYIRLEVDFRHYLKLADNTVLASRFWGGFGYAYGNSTQLPYVKAFFAGGTNDIRAFRSRGLGPGSYYTPDTARFLIDQPGDIKLEGNVELRTKLFSVVNGAIFVDAGNIWTLRRDSTRPGAQFTGNFLNQVAIGGGAGLRFDLTILVLRLDVAYPLVKPYAYSLTPSQLVYNLAIGYPF